MVASGIADGAAGPVGDVFDKLMDVSRGYFSMAEALHELGQNKETGMEAMNAWLENMQEILERLVADGGLLRPDVWPEQFKGMMTFWDLPMDTWKRLAANVIPMPGDYTKAFHPERRASRCSGQVNKFPVDSRCRLFARIAGAISDSGRSVMVDYSKAVPRTIR
jgi:hypothetical protein